MSLRVDIHVIIDSFERQLNTWRNIARLFSRTNYIMMLDVDFSICTDFRTAVRSSEVVMGKLRAGMMALVVPAFEFANHAEGLNVARFPRDKKVNTWHFFKIVDLRSSSHFFRLRKIRRYGVFIHSGSQGTIAQIIRGMASQFVQSSLLNLQDFMRRTPERSTKLHNTNLLTSPTSYLRKTLPLGMYSAAFSSSLFDPAGVTSGLLGMVVTKPLVCSRCTCRGYPFTFCPITS